METTKPTEIIDLSEFFDEPVLDDKQAKRVEDFAHRYITNGQARLEGVNYSEVEGLPLTVRANLARVQAKYADRFDITTENVLAEYAKAAFFDPKDLFHEDGRLKQVHELDNQVSAAIAGLSVTQVGGSKEGWIEEIKYKFADKLKALDGLSKQLGLFQDNINIKHSGEISDTSDNEKSRRLSFMIEEILRKRLQDSEKSK